MGHTSFTDRLNVLDAGECRALLRIAAEAIRGGLDGRAPVVDVDRLTPALRRYGATFVTLKIDDALRGCIGSLEASRFLAVDVAENAYQAAYRDPRFPPLDTEELASLYIHISVLNPAEPMTFASEADLAGQLRCGVDGVILDDNGCRATFLPAVWASIDDPREFLRHLKLKAGLAPTHWSPTVKAWRYTTRSIS